MGLFSFSIFTFDKFMGHPGDILDFVFFAKIMKYGFAYSPPEATDCSMAPVSGNGVGGIMVNEEDEEGEELGGEEGG